MHSRLLPMLWPALRSCGMIFGFVCGVLGLQSASAQGSLEQLEEEAFRQAAAIVDPSVVRIETVGGLERVGALLVGTGATTGVVVSSDGLIISSSFNFIAMPSSILVTLADGRRFPARQIAEDKSRMLTLLKIDAVELTVPQVAPRSSFRVGQWALAIGRTYEGGQIGISAGIVSAVDRVWGKALQTDAKVSPVNYGGPLVDVQGRVLGILAPMSPTEAGETAGVEWYDSGIGFAVPFEDLLAVLDRLKAGENLLPGLIGVIFKGENPAGGETEIDRVRYRSPAEEAGLKTGDRIVEVEGHAVATLTQLKQVLGRKYAGETLTLAVQRGDDKVPVELTLAGELLPFRPAFLGILPARLKTSETNDGVKLRYVFPDSPAAQAGLKAQDIIVRCGDRATPTADALQDAVNRLRPGEKTSFTWKSGDQEQTAELTLAEVPETMPEELPTPVLESAAVYPPDGPARGRISETLAAHGRDYWAYVPDDYNPAEPQGLVVWLHPAGDTQEAAMLKDWKAICDRRGVILIAPKAEQLSGWTLNDAEFVTDLIAWYRDRYTIDPHRIAVFSHGTGGPLGWLVTLKNRALIKGCAISSSPLPFPASENDPVQRQQFFLLTGEKDAKYDGMRQTAERLKLRGFPVAHPRSPNGDGRLPTGAPLEELGLWIDALDRI